MRATFSGGVSIGYAIDGRFPLLQQLGTTKWSSAWLTELDDRRAQKAAIKIFPLKSADVDATIARWDVARAISHPHLMPLFYTGHCEVDGEYLLYLVTEYADETLSQILPERPLSPQEIREMLDPVLDALAYLHKLGLTHGHLRSTNIMVVDDQVKLSPDFGWRSRTHSIYDPPEAIAGNAAPADDIWSLGVLLVEALTQQPPPWDRWQRGEPKIPATIPEPYFTICRECLRIDPERRCTLDRIHALLNPAPPAEPAIHPAKAAKDRIARPPYRFLAAFSAGALLFLSLMIFAFRFGWDLTPSSSEREPHHSAAQPSSPPAQSAATAIANSAGQIVQRTPTPAPATAPPKGGVLKGWIAQQILPDIPEKTLGAIHGHLDVAIRVEVDPEGSVSRALVQSPGPSVYFANQALQAAQNWTFIPAQVDGHAAASTWLLQFQFDPSQIAVTPSEVSP
ncbi:MAG TPA: TonB family protein [Bryobacteraceae bacterium]|nr:TonB family protein [Bryobacteraceae bacterium]